jgi:hypothetical protein
VLKIFLKFLLALYGFILYCGGIDENEQAAILTGRCQKHREKGSFPKQRRHPGVLRH